MDVDDGFPSISPVVSVGSCLALAFLYVSSLYIWTYEHNRDHPTTVKKRFCSVFFVMLISPIFVYLFSSKELFDKASLSEAMGFRRKGLISAVCIPLLHTAVLFLGPLTIQILNGSWKAFLDKNYWIGCFTNVLWLRNHIVAPISEEFTFRASMMPLLMQSFAPLKAVFITPLFFGVAHFHHMVDRIRNGMELKTVIIVSCFQFAYTTIFGFYSAYLFARTGHFAAPFVAHAFCNHMGFPEVQELIQQEQRRRNILIGIYVLGLSGWILLMPIVTNPSWYGNDLWLNWDR